VKSTTHLRLVPRSNNGWSCTSTPPCAFMARCLVRGITGTTLLMAACLRHRVMSFISVHSKPYFKSLYVLYFLIFITSMYFHVFSLFMCSFLPSFSPFCPVCFICLLSYFFSQYCNNLKTKDTTSDERRS